MNRIANSTGVSLSQIARRLGAVVNGDGNPRITGLHHDSRSVEPGDLFVARQGQHSDGLKFVPQAIQRGAVGVIVESGQKFESIPVPVLVVGDIRTAIGQAANEIYEDPTRSMEVVGITGTNGKTTSSYMVRTAIDGAGKRCGVLGTLGAMCGEQGLGGVHTTPEADEVTRIAAWMRDISATHLVMEVSSHALDQRRADGVRFSVAAYTNLTQDHLDYHGTIEAYASAKDRLFMELGPKAAVLMVDDGQGVSLADRASGAVPVCLRVSVHADSGIGRRPVDVCPVGPVRFHARGVGCRVRTPSGEYDMTAPFVGQHNLANLLLTLGIVTALELPVDRAIGALSSGLAVPGRLERCESEHDDITVLVDYAHTPDALERALRAIRPLTSGKVVCVFGCGGDRDRLKRPIMGNIVGELADVAVVTNDNPRSEAPDLIAGEIVAGMKGVRSETVVELDRSLAIGFAIGKACAGDVVLIAGKGHEPYQILGDRTVHFDDREEARIALRGRRESKRLVKAGE
ncbi:MAG: UDP-N-acetylmuramoyl-L-alanyl-D-glutamate--2,6-diaminopimelate ligase [Polyangiaceae bacterium]|nr:UDP-N-acetylmuramoyl-L-alanyl-D-glutamate--2,6-diaminopimelate ligase [Polyangiaceae bacterium]